MFNKDFNNMEAFFTYYDWIYDAAFGQETSNTVIWKDMIMILSGIPLFMIPNYLILR
ncbi:MAG: hypothetical protein ACLUOI_24805 [Eisenbergiella sp.]